MLWMLRADMEDVDVLLRAVWIEEGEEERVEVVEEWWWWWRERGWRPKGREDIFGGGVGGEMGSCFCVLGGRGLVVRFGGRWCVVVVEVFRRFLFFRVQWARVVRCFCIIR